MPDPTIEEMAARYVAELRAEHQGPYILGGYSGGGIVTFEMVRQLQELGEDVRYLVLFDSVPPGKADPPELTAAAQHPRPTSRRHGFGPLKPYIKAHLKMQIKRVHPGSGSAADRAIEHERARARTASTSRPSGSSTSSTTSAPPPSSTRCSTIDVDAALLKAEWVWPVQPHDYYWGRHINGQLDIAEVPGDHHAMFYPENAPRLAEVLSSDPRPPRPVTYFGPRSVVDSGWYVAPRSGGRRGRKG